MIRVKLDASSMKEAVNVSKFPRVQELRHSFRGSDRYSVLVLTLSTSSQ